MKARIAEIFKSIQGEGLYLGREQLFIRFHGCNLRCFYCDTIINYFKEMTVEEVLGSIRSYPECSSLSLTGGEPLLQVDFLKSLLPFLKQERRHIYLETNGVLYEELEKVVDYLDTIAMDFKLPSSTRMKSFFPEHKRFLSIASQKDVFVKSVITENTLVDDLKKTLELIKEIDERIILILQPQHPHEELLQTKLSYFEQLCRHSGLKVRVIPQLHKQLGIK
jgi:organic radical activating enzyme